MRICHLLDDYISQAWSVRKYAVDAGETKIKPEVGFLSRSVVLVHCCREAADSKKRGEFTDVALVIVGKSRRVISVATKPSCEIRSLGLGTVAKLVEGHLAEQAGRKQKAPVQLLIQHAPLIDVVLEEER